MAQDAAWEGRKGRRDVAATLAQRCRAAPPERRDAIFVAGWGKKRYNVADKL